MIHPQRLNLILQTPAQLCCVRVLELVWFIFIVRSYYPNIFTDKAKSVASGQLVTGEICITGTSITRFKGPESNATKLRPFSIPLSPLIQHLAPFAVGLVI
jgi:hypothetical protein